MINWIITAFMLLANIVAALLVYHSFGRDTDNNKKIMYSLIIIGGMYIVTLAIYFFSGIGVGKIENAETMRSYMMMAFVPVNTIVLIPFVIYSCMEAKRKKIKMKQLNQRLVIIEIIAIIIIIGEFIYFRNTQKNMKTLYDQLMQENKNSIVIKTKTEQGNDDFIQNVFFNEDLTNIEITNKEEYTEDIVQENKEPGVQILENTITNELTESD